MLGLRTHALVTGGLFAALFVLGWGGNAIDAYGLMPRTPGVQMGALIFFLLLTAALAFSAVPLMVLLVIRFHIAAGNANRPSYSLGDRACARDRIRDLGTNGRGAAARDTGRDRRWSLQPPRSALRLDANWPDFVVLDDAAVPSSVCPSVLMWA